MMDESDCDPAVKSLRKERFQQLSPVAKFEDAFPGWHSSVRHFAKFNEMFEITKFIPELPIDSWWFFGAVLAGLIIAIALVIRFVSSETDDIDPVEIDRQMLSSVRELTRTGEITEDEYRSIKGRLVDRLKDAEDEPVKPETSRSSKPSILPPVEITEQQNLQSPKPPGDLTDSDSDDATPST